MMSEFKEHKILIFYWRCKRLSKIKTVMKDVDYVFHAALKHVPLAEYNPFEAVKTNILGAQNIIDAAYENNVESVMALAQIKPLHQ